MAPAVIADIRRTCYNSDVYEPSDDSFALVDALVQEQAAWAVPPPRLCVEIGSGSGYVITSLALLLASRKAGAHCVAVDVSAAAVAATLGTLRAHSVRSVDVLRCDLLAPLLPRLAGQVDLLVFNPPYVPTPEEEVARGGIAAAWAGGYAGRRVTDRVLPLVGELLSRRGHLFLVTVPENDPQGILAELRDQGLAGRIALTRSADEELLHILHCWRPAAPS